MTTASDDADDDPHGDAERRAEHDALIPSPPGARRRAGAAQHEAGPVGDLVDELAARAGTPSAASRAIVADALTPSVELEAVRHAGAVGDVRAHRAQTPAAAARAARTAASPARRSAPRSRRRPRTPPAAAAAPRRRGCRPGRSRARTGRRPAARARRRRSTRPAAPRRTARPSPSGTAWAIRIITSPVPQLGSLADRQLGRREHVVDVDRGEHDARAARPSAMKIRRGPHRCSEIGRRAGRQRPELGDAGPGRPASSPSAAATGWRCPGPRRTPRRSRRA